MSTGNSEQSIEINAYEGHPELTQLEAEVLWEYAKFAKQVKQVSQNETAIWTRIVTIQCS